MEIYAVFTMVIVTLLLGVRCIWLEGRLEDIQRHKNHIVNANKMVDSIDHVPNVRKKVK